MAIEEMRLRITGKLPLIMHSNRGVNPREPLARELKTITSKRTKSEEDQDQIAFLEWQLGLYHDREVGPHLPPNMVIACLRDGAKKSKQGKTVVEAVWIDEPTIRLEYDGPRDIDGMYADGRFFDLRPASVMGRTVNRARPIFPQWAAEFTLIFDSEIIDAGDVLRIAEVAGQRVGLGDYRPTYGRFVVSQVNGAKGGRARG